MPVYTYYLADTLTGRLISEVSLSGVSYDLRVNDSAQFRGTLPMDSMPGLLSQTYTGRTALYVDRSGQLIWSGIVWGRDYSKKSRLMTLDCEDWLSYLDHIQLSTNLVYTAKDQLAIARSLVGNAMGKGGSDLRLVFVGSSTSGITRDKSYLGADQATFGQRLRELANTEQGFDFRFWARWEGSLPAYARRVLQFGYPTLGRAWPTSQVLFEASADCEDWEFIEDAKSSASTIYAIGGVANGSPANTLPPTYTADNAQVRASGYPRLEAARTYSDTTASAHLQVQGRGELARIQWPLQTMKLTIRPPDPSMPPPLMSPDLGQYWPGDQCLFRVDRGDEAYPNGAEILANITGVSVTVDEQHNELVTVDLAVLTITENPA